MVVKTDAKIITAFVYDKKNKETKELTGEKGVMLSLLIDENPENALSGEVISPFVDPALYRGIIDFSHCKRFEPVEIVMDYNVSGNKKFYKLFDLNRIEKKK